MSENSRQKTGTLTHQVKYLRDELEGTQDKSNNKADNLKSVLNVYAVKKETLENRAETL